MSWAQVDRGLAIFSRWVALCGLSMLLLLALFIIGEIIVRWLFNAPYEGVGDVTRVVLPIVVSSCFPLALLQQRHVSVRILGQMLGRRWQACFNLFGAILMTLFFSLVAWQFTLYTMELQAVGEHTWVIQIPLAPWWWITTGVVASCVPLQVLVSISNFLREVSGPRALRAL